jgi:hypothetical protein
MCTAGSSLVTALHLESCALLGSWDTKHPGLMHHGHIMVQTLGEELGAFLFLLGYMFEHVIHDYVSLIILQGPISFQQFDVKSFTCSKELS